MGRLLVGFLGGYITSLLVANAIIALLPFARGELVMWGMMLVFALFTGLFMYVFAVRTWWIGAAHLAMVSAIAGAVYIAMSWLKGWP